MCLAIYIVSNEVLPLIPWNEEQPGFHVIDLTDSEQIVRDHFTESFVYYAGSYEGCGCGFNFGHEYPDDDDDPAELRAADEARDALIDYLTTALSKGGSLKIFSCWEGEQSKDPETFRVATPEAFRAKDFVFSDAPELTTIERGG